MKRGKSLLFIGAAILCSLPLTGKADFSGFVEQLRESNIPIDKILTQTGVSRYELTRLLNAVECKDCINPDESYLKVYTEKYWKQFSSTPGTNFKDISYADAMFNKKDYFYCVAYVGENGYMKGYPETSPICKGEFCGARNVTNAEFLQVVMNMIGKYIYSSYSLNWTKAKIWISNLDKDSYEYKNFSSQDISTINDKTKTCKNQACALENTDQLNIYLKYCMFNLESCGMVAFDKVKEGFWPVAELNLLSKQKIVSIDEAASYNINEYIAGNLLIKIFSNMSSIIGCSFNNDYDCDGISNTQDRCPNVYNPKQTDTDKDGMGDVCDGDIDGDGVKNPIGIVDDNGNIIVELREKGIDNCLFVANKDQKHTTSNLAIGDACADSQNISLAIAIPSISGDLPQTVSLEAVHKTTFNQYTWDFGDGAFANGEKTNHTYTKPGTYYVRLIAKTNDGTQSLAKTTIVVGRVSSEKIALQALLQSTTVNKDASVGLNLSAIGDFDYFEWSFGDGSVIQTKSTKLIKIFRNEGSIGVTVKGIKNGEIVAITTFTLAVGNAKGTLLKASVLNPDKDNTTSFSTTTAGFFSKDVKSVSWDFGDGTSLLTQSLNASHIYKKSGQKVVIQTIDLANGVRIQNMLTIYVIRPYLFNSYSISLLPNMNGSTISPVGFTTQIKGGFETPISFRTIYGDNLSQSFGVNAIRSPFISEHRYINPDVYYPQTSLMLDACLNLSAQATVDVGGNDFCLEAKLNGTLNKLGCDMDKDGIPDICDTDIDADGKPNLLGIISDPKQCDYIQQIKTNGLGLSNSNGSINYDVLNKHFQGVCSLDNDPFESNDQSDSNNNNIGDGLDNALSNGTGKGNIWIQTSFLDGDNDGIPDNQDICPLLGETYNGIQDTDGCPEIGVEINCEDSRLPIISETKYICGNGITEPGENCNNCPADVGLCSANCGNGIIDKEESCQTCPKDVGSCTSRCGDKIVEAGETCYTCPTDAGICTSTCGNGKIDAGETCNTCPADAGTCTPNCGNSKVDAGETCQSCPKDIGPCISTCGNGRQEIGETCTNCPSDVKSCTTNCGNGVQEAGETCTTCPSDAKYCDINCANDTIDSGETCNTCPVDLKERCASQCGNGIIESNLGEQCDNGLINNGKDGRCTLNCALIGGGTNTTCGNGKIDVGESCQSCPNDVGSCTSTCGNGVQEVGETCTNCPSDVKSCTTNCGNGVQEAGETCTTCPSDAKYCGINCSNGKIDIGESCQSCPVDLKELCTSQCGNGIIESSLGEQCDNGLLKNGKDGKCSLSCLLVGGSTELCGNGKIDAGETCNTCAKDVQRCFSACGNGIIESNLGEQCDNGLTNNGKDGKCGLRCTIANTCGNGVQDGGEDCFTCPQDTKGCLVIVAKECLQCPCPFADFAANLTNGDQIKAVLWDKTKRFPWSYSIGYEIGY